MPRLSIWSLRLALLYLGTGFTLGALLLVNKGLPINGFLWALLPAHIEFLLVGWVVQLIIGVAFWILPRLPQPPKRGNVSLAWAALIALNLGIWFSALGPLWISVRVWVVLLGRLAEFVGAGLFLVYAWPRVKPARG